MVSSRTLGGAVAFACLASSTAILPDFPSPPKDYGVKFRYWFPDASVEIDEVVKDIDALEAVGAGGLLFCPYYNYGFRDPSLPPWDEFGFGGSRFKDVFVAAAEAANAAGLTFDFSLGGNQGQGVPAEPLTPGLAVQLVYGEATIESGESFDGKIPEANTLYNFDLGELANFMHGHENWGPNTLLAVVAGGVKSVTQVNNPRFPEHQLFDVAVDEQSLIDLTGLVVDGNLTWTAPSDFANYTLFAVYERYTNQRSVDATELATDIIGNGSWITDHFSASGANLATQFWEDYMLDADVKQLLKAVGEHSWEDSLEMSSALWWSQGFMDRFEANRGYNPAKYLPLMFHQSNVMRAGYPPYNKTYVLDTVNSGQSKYLQDYRLTLNDGYQEYLETIELWSQSLGLTFNAQVAYNLPLDMRASVPVVGGPETETLAFPDIDHLTQFTGAAHLSGRRVISSEVGASMNGAYSTPAKDLINLFRMSFAGGVNVMSVHGMPYGGEYRSTWPGYTVLQYAFGDMWGPRIPDWLYMHESMAYTARNQLVLQTGTPKMDIAIYHHDEPWSMALGYESDDLRSAGFTYEYLGSDSLASDNAVAAEGVLAPGGPSYQALVFNYQQHITPHAALKVLDFAKKGLPIFVLGAFPNTTIGSEGQALVSEAMESAATYNENVKFVTESELLSESLIGHGLEPRVNIDSGTSDLYSVWRSTDDADFVFFYNEGDEHTFKLTFKVSADKIPYRLDAWNGEQSEVVVYDRSEDGLSLSVALSANQTTIFAFVTNPGPEVPTYVTSHSANIEKIERGPDDELIAYITDNAGVLTLSTGKEVALEGSTCTGTSPQIILNPWNLTIESWVPGSDQSSSRSVVETIPLGPQASLVPWTNIPEVRNVSGVGIYTTAFTMQDGFFNDSRRDAVFLHFGPVLNTIRAWVNDKLLPPMDTENAEVDISEFLSLGSNTIRVEVSSSLFNAVKARVDWVESVGQPPRSPGIYEGVDFKPFGLTGSVTVRQLRKVVVEG